MPTPTRQIRRSVADGASGGLRPVALAAALLAPAPRALANDRDLRGTPVPAAACVEFFRRSLSQEPWDLGYF